MYCLISIKQYDLRGIYFQKTIKKFWGYRGIFQNPPKSFLNYLFSAKFQFIVIFSCFLAYIVKDYMKGRGKDDRNFEQKEFLFYDT